MTDPAGRDLLFAAQPEPTPHLNLSAETKALGRDLACCRRHQKKTIGISSLIKFFEHTLKLILECRLKPRVKGLAQLLPN